MVEPAFDLPHKTLVSLPSCPLNKPAFHLARCISLTELSYAGKPSMQDLAQP